MNSVLTVFFFIITFLPVTTYAQTTEVYLEEIDYTKEMLDLELHYDSILDYQETERCISYKDAEKTICDATEPVIQYLYKTDTFAPEDVIAKNTRKLDDKTYQVYGSDTFYQPDGAEYWVYTEFGISEKSDFDVYQADQLKNADEVSFINNPFKIYKVNAQIYSAAGDGNAMKQGDGWATVRGAADATTANYTNTSELFGWYEDGISDQLGRGFIPFDTSSLEDGQCVASSTFSIVQYSSLAGSPQFALVYTTQANGETLSTADYNNTDFIKISADKTISAGARHYVNLTATTSIDLEGYTKLGWFLKEDIDNTTLTAHKYARFYMSEQTSTANDPWILIELTDCPDEEIPPTTSTTTLSELPALPFVDDLTVITGRTDHYESSTTAADWSELHYYRIPFIVWIILAIPLLWISERLLWEFLIRWRK